MHKSATKITLNDLSVINRKENNSNSVADFPTAVFSNFCHDVGHFCNMTQSGGPQSSPSFSSLLNIK